MTVRLEVGKQYLDEDAGLVTIVDKLKRDDGLFYYIGDDGCYYISDDTGKWRTELWQEVKTPRPEPGYYWLRGHGRMTEPVRVVEQNRILYVYRIGVSGALPVVETRTHPNNNVAASELYPMDTPEDVD